MLEIAPIDSKRLGNVAAHSLIRFDALSWGNFLESPLAGLPHLILGASSCFAHAGLKIWMHSSVALSEVSALLEWVSCLGAPQSLTSHGMS